MEITFIEPPVVSTGKKLLVITLLAAVAWAPLILLFWKLT